MIDGIAVNKGFRSPGRGDVRLEDTCRLVLLRTARLIVRADSCALPFRQSSDVRRLLPRARAILPDPIIVLLVCRRKIMKQSLFFSLVVCLLCAGLFHVAAQVPAPPKVLLIVREEIKPGMMPAHSREANNVVQIYSKANSPYHRLAMTPVAGNENEVMYFWGFPSFAEMEKSNSVLDTISNVTFKADFDRVRPPGEDYHSSQRDIIAVLREDMSYNMNTDISKMRYMRVQTIRVKPGHAREWEESRRMSRAAHEKAKVDETMVVYQVAGGAQSGTYLVMIPWATLDGIATIPHGKSYMEALGEDRRHGAVVGGGALLGHDVLLVFNLRVEQ